MSREGFWEDGGRLCFETALFRRGSDSFLNPFVYNRELASLLLGAAAAGLVYLGFLHGRPAALSVRLAVPVLVFLPVFLLMRFAVLRERRVRLEVDRAAGRIRLRRDRFFGAGEQDLSLAEVRLLEVIERPPPDESDIREIVRWQEMAEPGVHPKPAALYRLELVLAGGRRFLVYTDDDGGRVDGVRRRLAAAMGLI